MIKFLRHWRKRAEAGPETRLADPSLKELLEGSGMPSDELEAFLADEHLSQRVRVRVMAGLRERAPESQVAWFPSPARVTLAFSLLTVVLLALAWTAPRFRPAGVSVLARGASQVEPAPAGPACQLGGVACRVSPEQALSTLVQLEPMESRK
jgi:hypothetical protein